MRNVHADYGINMHRDHIIHGQELVMALGISVGCRVVCMMCGMLIDQELVKAVFRESRSVRSIQCTYVCMYDVLSVRRLVFMLMFGHDCGASNG